METGIRLSTIYHHFMHISPSMLHRWGYFFYIATTDGLGVVAMTESFLKYLQTEKRLSANTVLAYQTDLEQFTNFLSTQYPDFTSESADHGVIRAWIINLVDTKLDPRSVNRKIACLRSYYKYLMRKEVITKDPTIKIKVLKTQKNLPHFITENEIIGMLDKAPFDDNTFDGCRDRLMLELFYATGIRVTELVTLQESNVDIDNRTIRVLGKRNKERVIPFPAGLVSILEGYRMIKARDITKKDHGLLFVTKQGNPWNRSQAYLTVKKYLEQYTHVQKKSPHVLRHTYATHLLNKGAEINAVKDLLGHSSLAATQVYTHNSIEKLKKTFELAHPKA